MSLTQLLSLVAGTSGSSAKAAEALAVLDQMYAYHDQDHAAVAPAPHGRDRGTDYDHGYALVASGGYLPPAPAPAFHRRGLVLIWRNE